MNISSVIAGRILDMIQKDGMAQICRRELAEKTGCAPSQINYVIASRFTPEQGYMVESRRGSGGYIRITRIGFDGRAGMVMHLVNSIGPSLDENTARIHIGNLAEMGAVSPADSRLLLSAMNRNAYRFLSPESAGRLRAEILKQMLLATLPQSGGSQGKERY